MTVPSGPLWLVGCGNMGGAMLDRWIADGVDPAAITVITRSMRDVPAGVRHATALPAGETPAVVVLAVKPQQLDAVATDLAPAIAGAPLLISILAGVEEAALARRFDVGTIVRAMPNLPVAIGQGVVALHSHGTDRAARTTAEALMAPLGLVEWIDDAALFDAVTALSGCGPGFVFRFIDALAAAGAALGLPADQAQRLAIATVRGSATMAAGADVSPAALADRVASPGGSTRQGLNVLDEGDALKHLLAATLAASERRNAEMAAAARQTSSVRGQESELGPRAYVAVDGANCLYKPDTGAAIRMSPPFGSFVSVLEEKDGWALISAFGKEGWTPSQNLSLTKGERKDCVDVGCRPRGNTDYKPTPLESSAEPPLNIEYGPRGGQFVRTASGFRRYF